MNGLVGFQSGIHISFCNQNGTLCGVQHQPELQILHRLKHFLGHLDATAGE